MHHYSRLHGPPSDLLQRLVPVLLPCTIPFAQSSWPLHFPVGYSGCRVKLPRRRYLINPALPGLAIGTCFRLDRGILFA